MGRGSADRVARVGAQSDRSEARADRRRRPTARAGGDAIERVRVACVTGQPGAHRVIGGEGELGHVRFGNHDSPRLAQSADLKCVVRRHRAHERERAARSREIICVVVVLDDDRYPMQGTDHARFGELAV